MVKCSKCGTEVNEGDIYVVDGKELCDDCSLILSMQKTVLNCDNNPAVVPVKRNTEKK